ncbi:MAG: potassium/proton antiporter [Candidatus Latescibacteria bacterium]|nr:potassium/proton antiporter [Candidatus Latescibacterota bacterium]
MISIEYILLGASILLLLSIIASRISGRLGVPALLVFLLVGMLAGAEGPGGIYFDDPWLAKSLGTVALVFILFAGGLQTSMANIKPVLWKGITLSTLGVIVTAVLVGIFVTLLFNFSVLEGMLLGAVVSSTDVAAVFSILRSKKSALRGKLKPLLEFESGSNDPMAIFLTIGLIYLIIGPTNSVFRLILMFLQQMIFGALLGYFMGKGVVLLINRLRLEYESLYPVLTISFMLLCYGLTAAVGGNGFLAVYIAGIVMGNSRFIHKKSLMHFHDGFAWLMQIIMFLTLGLLVFPSRIVPIIWIGLLVSVFLMFIARPVSVFLCTAFTKMSVKEKTMISWVGLRGAVPIILATFPLLANIPKADMIFNIVFFIVITSALLQGTSIPIVARWLGLDMPYTTTIKYPIDFEHIPDFHSESAEIEVPQNSVIIGKQIVDIGIPPNTLIILICRDRKFFVPNGMTVLQAKDILKIIADKNEIAEVRAIVEQKHIPPETIV